MNVVNGMANMLCSASTEGVGEKGDSKLFDCLVGRIARGQSTFHLSLQLGVI
jgi:hypothetical protein